MAPTIDLLRMSEKLSFPNITTFQYDDLWNTVISQLTPSASDKMFVQVLLTAMFLNIAV